MASNNYTLSTRNSNYWYACIVCLGLHELRKLCIVSAILNIVSTDALLAHGKQLCLEKKKLFMSGDHTARVSKSSVVINRNHCILQCKS